jgi:fatty acid amide hydrolase
MGLTADGRAAAGRQTQRMNMTSTANITSLSASEIATSIATGQLTAVDAVESHIARIEAVNPSLNAVVVPLFDDAIERARVADRTPTSQRGPLHGVPVTVKECFDVAGTPSTVGLPARAGFRATGDAPLVARLRQAGGIILGKTNVAQMLMYVESDNPLYGRADNPWDLARSPGGSSGGEAAIVAACGSALGLGTDIGGSVRVPAHCCGVQSLKPTPGLLSVEGTPRCVAASVIEAVPDSGGLIARRVADLQLALSSLTARAGTGPDVGALKVAFYDDDGYFPASPALQRAVREAAAILGARGCEVVEFKPDGVPEALDVFYGIFSADGGDEWRRLLAGGAIDPRMKDLLTLAGTPGLARPLATAAFKLQGQSRLARVVATSGRVSDQGVRDLLQRRDEVRRRFAATMSAAGIDVIICPPSCVPAVTHGATKDLGPASVSYTCLYNLLAYPAGVVTTTRVRDDETSQRPQSREKMARAARAVDEGSAGLPVGVQVVAKRGGEDRILAVMQALEDAAGTYSPPDHLLRSIS